ncbi:MAG: R3H domain-containing nucleic acid-binding protein [Patescibacteria group bacterium]|nr:R3H domain-containing nucleic acid-binding protein [bacterium]MDZ4227357.1 R3H domain-containing nucleic acid-binding protein [Patescibacteria group bacterium]
MQPSPETILKGLLDAAAVPYASVEHGTVAGQDVYSIKAEGDARDIIGPRGDVLHALDHLVKKIYEQIMASQSTQATPEVAASEGKDSRAPLFLVDVDEYRSHQIRDLQAKVMMMAERARSFQYDVELSPMSSYERLIVHTTLSNEPNVKTESQGEGRGRRVVIKYTSE